MAGLKSWTAAPGEPIAEQPREQATRPAGWLTRRDWIAILVLLLVTLVVSLPSLRCTGIDDLDSAHHLMDGYFFHDIIHDHPDSHLQQYVTSYYKQYPALGFIYWPPFFPFVLGLFDLVFGPHLLTARLCLLFFGAVFAVGFYAMLRRSLPLWLSLTATVAAVTVPGMVWSFNKIMLELPTLAVMCLAVLAFYHVMDHREDDTSVGRGLLCGVACAAVIYTKQPAWFLYPALLVEALRHRRIFRKPEAWIVVGSMVILCLPLVLFMMKFGHADLAESVGNNIKFMGHSTLPRRSIASWVFYPDLGWSLLNPVVWILTCGALVLAFLRPAFRRRNALWLAWFVFFYLTFSFYGNKDARYATFWWPAWIALAAACLDRLLLKLPRQYRVYLPLLFLLPVPLQLAHSWHQDYTDYRGEHPLVADLFANGSPGNVLVFGTDKQTFVALIREDDPSRQVHVLRGDSLLSDGLSVADMCREYRIRTILVELPPLSTLAQYPGLQNLSAGPQLSPLPDGEFRRRGVPIQVIEFRYTGPIDPVMADVPLSGRLL
jgi:hypothetical protein